MVKKLLMLLCAVLGISQTRGVTLPTASTADKAIWYVIQFMNQGNVIEGKGDGKQARTAALNLSMESSISVTNAQLWKLEGDNTNGYKLINKNGQYLYLDNSARDAKVYAGKNVSGKKVLFKLMESQAQGYTGGLELQPAENNEVSINQFGGASSNAPLGLWNKNDAGNVLKFVSLGSSNENDAYGLIPYPTSLEKRKDGKLSLKDFTAISAAAIVNEQSPNTVQSFADRLKMTSGIELTIKANAGNEEAKAINLIEDKTIKAEGYSLKVEDDRITIKASNGAGFFYGLETLKQLMPRDIYGKKKAANAAWEVPFLSIADQPLLERRGFMMDVARHFFSKAEVMRVLDLMATYKLNLMHWHLTDDQGWRIEIPEYPLLTEVGSIRAGSFVSPGDGSGKFFDDTEYGRGMWYSQEDLKEIVAYAKERHIEILPEVDLPGHMVAAVAAYPELSCDPSKKYSVRIDGGISHDVLNIGDDKVIDFLKCIMDNLAKVFPYPYIHFGGDECPTEQWAVNEACLKRVQDNGLNGVEELQSWLVEELGTYVKTKHNKDIVVWDELLKHWNDKNTVKPVIMAWNNINFTKKAADRGMRSICVPYQTLYIDMMQVPPSKTVIDEPYFGGWTENQVVSVEHVYGTNPLSHVPGQEEFVMGVQANLWAETLNDSVELEYQLLPRILAVSEIGWLPNKDKSFISFLSRLQSHADVFEQKGLNYAKHYFVKKQLSENEQTLKDAKFILDKSVAGTVGFPAADIHNALKAAYDAAVAKTEDATLAALKTAMENYKNAPIIMPQAGKVYQIVSASIYYKNQYEGSTMYQAGDQVRFHYTPQTEPEELWSFEVKDGNYVMVNYGSGKKLAIGNFNANVSLDKTNGTTVRIDKATMANGTYTYIPGVVLISDVNGYSAEATGQVKRLTATGKGFVAAKNDPKLCNPGTWLIVEVEDFKKQLSGLVYKCELIVAKPLYGNFGEPSKEGVELLKNELIAPAKELIKGENPVSEADYKKYMDLYNQFLTMKINVMDAISEDYYYRIENAYFTNNFAHNENGSLVPKNSNSDASLWRFLKQEDGTVLIYNKSSKTPAYISSSAEGQIVKVGNNGSIKKWTLEEVTTDQSKSGIGILDPSKTYSWYCNPNGFKNVLLKPKDWGASIWNLIKTEEKVTVNIDKVEMDAESKTEGATYDLSGRRKANKQQGIFIQNGKKVIIK